MAIKRKTVCGTVNKRHWFQGRMTCTRRGCNALNPRFRIAGTSTGRMTMGLANTIGGPGAGAPAYSPGLHQGRGL